MGRMDVRGKIVILLMSFGLFAVGVWAVYSDRGPLRTTLLCGVFAGLIAIAVRQTVRRRRDGK